MKNKHAIILNKKNSLVINYFCHNIDKGGDDPAPYPLPCFWLFLKLQNVGPHSFHVFMKSTTYQNHPIM